MKSTKKKVVEPKQEKMRTVMISAPSYDGKVDVWHCTALAETAKIGLTKNINIIPIYMSYDALVQRARNDIFQMVYMNDIVDDLIFIDCDVDWNPADIFKLLNYDLPIVAAAVPKKSDYEQYGVKASSKLEIDDNGLVEVDGVGTAFMRVRRDAVKKIYERSDEYNEPHKEKPIRMVFNIDIVNGELYSEDMAFCKKWKDMGGKIYVDPSIVCGHSGTKRWIGNFYNWLKVFNKG